MLANVLELGTGFMQLIAARDSDLREDIEDYDGEGTALLDCYVLAMDEEGYDNIYKTELGKVELVRVECVTVIGSDFETRCYTNTVMAYKDEQGTLWLDEQLHDEVFC
jgi:hypothetical protein